MVDLDNIQSYAKILYKNPDDPNIDGKTGNFICRQDDGMCLVDFNEKPFNAEKYTVTLLCRVKPEFLTLVEEEKEKEGPK